MEKIFYIVLGAYFISFILGAIGSHILNKSIWIPRIGSYAIMTTGHYVFHFTSKSWYYSDKWDKWQNLYSNKLVVLKPGNNGHGGGKSPIMLSTAWWIKELFVMFPILGIYNLVLLLYSLISGVIFAIFVSKEVFGILPGIKAIGFSRKRVSFRPRNEELFDFKKCWII